MRTRMTVNPHVPTSLKPMEWVMIKGIVRDNCKFATRIGAEMAMEDLAIVHGTDKRMDLAAMCRHPDIELIRQDILGISEHLDRRTGKLLNGFVPRFLRSNTTRG